MSSPKANLESWIGAGGDPRLPELLGRAGRVAVFADGDARCLAAIQEGRPEVGTVGDWIGGAWVLEAAEAWLKAEGCTEVRGPMLMSPWLPAGANLGPLEHEPLLFEPTEPADRWVESGFEPHVPFVSILAGHDENITAGMDAAARLASRGWMLQTLDFEDEYETSVATVHDLVVRAFEGRPGFQTLPLRVVREYYRPLAGLMEGQLSRVALTPEGEAVAFIIAYPEPAAAGRSWFQILSLAVVPEQRHRGLASWMVAAVHQAARKAGFAAGVHSLVRVVGDSLEDTTWYRGEILRRYAVFRKSI